MGVHDELYFATYFTNQIRLFSADGAKTSQLGVEDAESNRRVGGGLSFVASSVSPDWDLGEEESLVVTTTQRA